VQVHCDEGVADHIGPEPCAVVREGIGEASVGDRIGQPLSREIGLFLGADAVLLAEGNTDGHARLVRVPVRPSAVGDPGLDYFPSLRSSPNLLSWLILEFRLGPPARIKYV
jgi:hypothetical protein